MFTVTLTVSASQRELLRQLLSAAPAGATPGTAAPLSAAAGAAPSVSVPVDFLPVITESLSRRMLDLRDAASFADAYGESKFHASYCDHLLRVEFIADYLLSLTSGASAPAPRNQSPALSPDFGDNSK